MTPISFEDPSFEHSFAEAMRTAPAPSAPVDLLASVQAGVQRHRRRCRIKRAVGSLAALGVLAAFGIGVVSPSGGAEQIRTADAPQVAAVVVTVKPDGWIPIEGVSPDEGNAEKVAAFVVRPTVCGSGMIHVFFAADGARDVASGESTTVQGYPAIVKDVPDNRQCSQEFRSISWRVDPSVTIYVRGFSGVSLQDLRLVAEGVQIR